jgi:hypothetical protein
MAKAKPGAEIKQNTKIFRKQMKAGKKASKGGKGGGGGGG